MIEHTDMKIRQYKWIWGLLLLLLFPVSLYPQITISGSIQEVGSGESISFAQIKVNELRTGTLSNESGFFSIDLPPGKVRFLIQRIGYYPLDLDFFALTDTFIQVNMIQASSFLDTVMIEAFSGLQDVHLGRMVIPMEQLKQLPALAGEGDVLKSLQFLPGVQFGQEGTSGLFVRGGSPDQNLILLDDMPVYNVNHLFGFFSLFPPGVIQDMEVYKGAFPAQYGGRLSSVIRLQVKEGNLSEWKGETSLSMLSGQVRVEGPLIPGKSSIFFAGRRSLIDLVLRPFTSYNYRREGVNGSLGYGFYDIITKANYIISPKSRLFVSVYAGSDQGKISIRPSDEDSTASESSGALQWGNITTSMRFQQVMGKKWFSKSVLGFTRYRYNQELSFSRKEVGFPEDKIQFGNYSSVNDWILKQEFHGQTGRNHNLRAGIQLSSKQFEPDVSFLSIQDGMVATDTSFREPPLRSQTASVYTGYEYSTPSLSLYLGLRAEGFFTEGKQWWSVQPRAKIGWKFAPAWKVEAGYSYIQQYIHLLTNSGLGLPTDLWVPATSLIPPASSQQITAGIFHEIDPRTTISIEGYWKQIEGVIEYKEGVSYINNFSNWQQLVNIGRGKSIGLEFFLHRRSGKWNGWIGYTLSKATRQFDEINDGIEFPFRYDRPHNVSMFLSRELPNPNKSISATWTFVSGARITVPDEQYFVPFDLVDQLTGFADNLITSGSSYIFGPSAVYAESRNNYSQRPFHKLDIAYRTKKAKRKFDRTWEFGVYNLYGRQNPYYVFYGTETIFSTTEPFVRNERTLREYSFLIWLPYIGYQISF